MEILPKLSEIVLSTSPSRYKQKKEDEEKFQTRLPSQVPAFQRVKGSQVATKDRSERGAVPGQEDGKDRGEGRECNQVHRKRTRGGNGASVPQVVRSFPSENVNLAGTIYRRVPTLQN